MEMHQLRYLEAVAEYGSIMAASAACHISQPGLSMQLKKLEEELGTPLLLRSARGVALTPAGERALVTARRVLREVSGLKRDAKQGHMNAVPVTKVGIQHFIASEVLPRLATSRLGAPLFNPEQARIEFSERAPARLAEGVRNGAFDVGFLDTSACDTSGLNVLELVRQPYLYFCEPTHPLARRKRLTLALIARHPLILHEHSPSLRERLHAEALGKKLTPVIPFCTESATTAFEMLCAHLGAAVLPASFGARAKRRHLIALPIEDYPEFARMSVIWREGEELPPRPAAFVERLRALLEEHGEGRPPGSDLLTPALPHEPADRRR